MKEDILPFEWNAESVHEKIYSIDNKLILLEKPVIDSSRKYPFRMDIAVAIICLRGTMKGMVDMMPYNMQGPCFFIFSAKQILQHESFSDDFQGLFIIVFKRFAEDLQFSAQESVSTYLLTRQNQWAPLNRHELDTMVMHFNLMKDIIQTKDNPYRMETLRHLTKAFISGARFHLYRLSNKQEEKTGQEALVEKFLRLVQTHYREERTLNFYADRLCLTPIHLSRVIKAISHKSANEWIDDHVILEAKALLKSTGMTIQQISEELNFPSQSFFGKYFKRCIGMSPREYKKR
jgi:YesN/AraC family two-component response regulator